MLHVYMVVAQWAESQRLLPIAGTGLSWLDAAASKGQYVASA